MKSIITLLIALFSYSIFINAQTKLAPLFTDHMVLQQETNAAVWGKDKPNTKVTVKTSWGESASVTTNKNGAWKLFIKTIKAGGPYTLEVYGSEKIILKDILLGEVWLCSGQSNMQMPMKGFNGQPVYGSNDFILNSKNSNLRIFNVQQNLSNKPLEYCEGTWEGSSPEAILNFSAVAYIYGKILQNKLDVPVGIISSAYGGTRVEAWTSAEVLTSKQFDLEIDPSLKLDKNNLSVLYNTMIHPLIPFGIKGFLWYQGESNRRNAEQYTERFSAMINSWRKEWNLGELPFYFVQIAPFAYKPNVNAAYLREAQLKTMLTVPNTGMAVTMDIGEEFNIHPPKKEEVAKRLAYLSLGKTYGFKGIQYDSPTYKSMKIENNKVYLKFNNAPGGVSNFGKELNFFIIAGADKVFHPAKAKIIKGKIYVSSDLVAEPVAVRYCWENYAEGSLFNSAGLPASSFRTDNW